jgi:hypothetical protein
MHYNQNDLHFIIKNFVCVKNMKHNKIQIKIQIKIQKN